jgi:hypothetical protein
MKTINATVGIYNTEYSATVHRNGEVTVRAPYVKWVGSTGHLAFKKVTVSGDDASEVKKFFDRSELALPANCFGGMLTLDDVLNGDRHPNVYVYN